MDTSPQPIKIAVLAMGGEGGGVLADWIVDLAEQAGYIAQTTSVAGVAQRTGATIYYLELFPRAAAEAAGAEPVLALIPTPGDVDVLLASELMEGYVLHDVHKLRILAGSREASPFVSGPLSGSNLS